MKSRIKFCLICLVLLVVIVIVCFCIWWASWQPDVIPYNIGDFPVVASIMCKLLC